MTLKPGLKKKNPTRYSVTAKVVPPLIHEIFEEKLITQ